MYSHRLLDPDGDPTTLQNKVQWDLRFYFARRANENIDKFTKGTFAVKLHEDSGLRYVVKCYDEQTKNHQLDLTDVQTACMVEIPETKLCPVNSFVKYKSHLSPLLDDLWQQPKNKNWQESEVWYKNTRMGSNPLSTFMSRLSHDVDLSQSYTNHSIRVTGTTYLTRRDFTPKQIMSITGHKSLNSLSIYQKVSTDEKLSMAYAMSCYLHSDKNVQLQIGPKQHETDQTLPAIPKENDGQIALPVHAHNNQPARCTPSSTVPTPGENLPNSLVTYESEDPFCDAEIPDFDLGQIMETIERENRISMTQKENDDGTTTTTNITQQHQFYQKKSP